MQMRPVSALNWLLWFSDGLFAIINLDIEISGYMG